jgi:hypothetical protein
MKTTNRKNRKIVILNNKEYYLINGLLVKVNR